MPKKSNKTARVLNLLAGGTESDDDLDFQLTQISKGKLPEEHAEEPSSDVVTIPVSPSFPWDDAEEEIVEKIMTDGSLEDFTEGPYPSHSPEKFISDINIKPIEMKVEFENNRSAASAGTILEKGSRRINMTSSGKRSYSGYTKPDVVVEVHNNESESKLSHIVRQKLEETLNAQIIARQGILQKDSGEPKLGQTEHETTPYSEAFASRFGSSSADNKPSAISVFPQEEEDFNNRSRENTQSDAANSGNKSGLYSEPYILEDFNDDESSIKIFAMNQIEEQLRKNFIEENHMGNEHKKVVKNLAEEVVRAKVPSIMEEMGMCTCEDCVLDVVAYTLNHISPLYTATEKGQLYSKLNSYEMQYGADISATITKACLKVKLNPTHSNPVHTV